MVRKPINRRLDAKIHTSIIEQNLHYLNKHHHLLLPALSFLPFFQQLCYMITSLDRGIHPDHQARLVMTRDKTDLINLENAGVKRDNRWLVRGIDLRIRKGQIVTIIGPNGAGKSTTAKLAVGTIRANEGRVQCQAGLRVGYVPQKLHIDPALPMRVDRLLDLTARVSLDEKNKLLKRLARHIWQRPLCRIYLAGNFSAFF